MDTRATLLLVDFAAAAICLPAVLDSTENCQRNSQLDLELVSAHEKSIYESASGRSAVHIAMIGWLQSDACLHRSCPASS